MEFARRNWARNENAMSTSIEFNQKHEDGHITIPYVADEELVKNAVAKLFN